MNELVNTFESGVKEQRRRELRQASRLTYTVKHGYLLVFDRLSVMRDYMDTFHAQAEVRNGEAWLYGRCVGQALTDDEHLLHPPTPLVQGAGSSKYVNPMAIGKKHRR